MFLRSLFVAGLLSVSLRAQDFSRVPPADLPEATRLVKIYREDKDQAARETAFDSLLRMNFTVFQALTPVVERDWQLAITYYQAAFARQAAETARRRSTNPAFLKDVAAQRAILAKLRGLDKALTKEQLHGEGEAALKKLQELHKITREELVTALPALGPARDAAKALTRMRVKLKKTTILRDTRDFSEGDIDREESSAIARAFRADGDTKKVLDANADFAARKAVPADEAEGVRDLNEMRMLLGLRPVLIDPKLHNAARDHSKDMATKKFFAHESPVPGKKTPGDRAKLAGTTANAENIYMGDADPHAANMGWFFSPGHHVNMFGNHRRVGQGRHEAHWTQMFGG